MKDKARSALWEIEEIYDEYKRIIEAVDPEEALIIARDIERSLGCYGGIRLSLPEGLYDEDFMSAVIEHKRRYATLRNAGVLDSFILLHQQIIKVVAEDLGPEMPLGPEDVYVIDIAYNPSTFKHSHIKTVHTKEDQLSLPIEEPAFNETATRSKSSDILESKPGFIRAYVMPSRYGYRRKETSSWLEYFIQNPPYIISKILDKIYELQFPQEWRGILHGTERSTLDMRQK